MHEFQVVFGHWNVASRIVIPGLMFCSWIYAATRGICASHQFVRLASDIREDIAIWAVFLAHYNGVSFWHELMQLHADLQVHVVVAWVNSGPVREILLFVFPLWCLLPCGEHTLGIAWSFFCVRQSVILSPFFKDLAKSVQRVLNHIKVNGLDHTLQFLKYNIKSGNSYSIFSCYPINLLCFALLIIDPQCLSQICQCCSCYNFCFLPIFVCFKLFLFFQCLY